MAGTLTGKLLTEGIMYGHEDERIIKRIPLRALQKER